MAMARSIFSSTQPLKPNMRAIGSQVMLFALASNETYGSRLLRAQLRVLQGDSSLPVR
jgi:hypothetical protein